MCVDMGLCVCMYSITHNHKHTCCKQRNKSKRRRSEAGVRLWEVKDYHHLPLNVSVSSYHCLPSSFFLLCLRATNKLWMLIRKGQYSASQINSAARDIKETQTKSADVGKRGVKVTRESMAG